MIHQILKQLKIQKQNSLINIVGLSIGIGSAIIISVILRFELSFDQFHTSSENIYRVVRVSMVEGQEEYRTGVALPLPDALRQLPRAESITSVLYANHGDISIQVPKLSGSRHKDKFIEKHGFAYADSYFFQIFDYSKARFKWLEGNPQIALTDPNSIVLTKTLARKYYTKSNDSLIGKTLIINNENFKITGIIEDLPLNSNFPFTAVMSYSSLNFEGRLDDWWSVGDTECYIKTNSKIDIDRVNKKIAEIHASYTPVELYESRKYKLQKISDVRRDIRFGNFKEQVVTQKQLNVILFIGVFLLVAACINYINIATARSTLRSLEIGVRKVLGSSKTQIVRQFLAESFVLTMIAGLVGIALAELLLPSVSHLLNIPINKSLLVDWQVWAFLGCLVILVGFLAGAYPALIISEFNVLKAIKGRISPHRNTLSLRKVLVVLQFSLVLIFLISSLVVSNQLKYILNADLGFSDKAIINLDISKLDQNQRNLLKNQLQDQTNISAFSFSSTVPSGVARSKFFVDVSRGENIGTESFITEIQSIDPNFFDVFDIEIKAGAGFTDSTPNNHSFILINETLARKAGFKSNEDAIESQMRLNIHEEPVKVIGVVSDFHSKSLRDDLDKIAFFYSPDSYSTLSIKFQDQELSKMQSSIGDIESLWIEVFPDQLFSYSFFDERIANYYKEEKRLSGLMKIFSLVLLVICLLGIYGLISFIIQTRMKEMAIRKTFGASIKDILGLVSNQFMLLIVIALSIAVPLSNYFLSNWLLEFKYRVDISLFDFILPLVTLVSVVLIVIGGKTLKAARMSPSRVLKEE